MNRGWMRERLDAFKALCEEYEREGRRRPAEYTDRQRDLSDEMASQEPTVKEILKHLDPKLAELVTEPQYLGGAHDSLRAVQKGLAILRDQDEWMSNLAPDAPSLVADQFHSHVWAAASPLWDTGKYRVAVGQAAVSLSVHIASKAGSPLTERELVAQVLSPSEPGAGQVRLHLPGDKASRTWKSRQEGLHFLARACSQGSGTWPRIQTTSGWSRWRWSTWPSCPLWLGGPTRPRSSPAEKRPASRSQRGVKRGVNRAALPRTARGGCDVFPQVMELCGTSTHRPARSHAKQPLGTSMRTLLRVGATRPATYA